MIELTHGLNPLHFAECFIDDETKSFTEVYLLRRLDENHLEALRVLEECAAGDCPQVVLVIGYSTLSESETMDVRRSLDTHGIQTCFAEDFARWVADAL